MVGSGFNQALLAGTPEADQLLEEQGYTPEQIELLKDAARSELSQTAFDRITGETVNPGISEGVPIMAFPRVSKREARQRGAKRARSPAAPPKRPLDQPVALLMTPTIDAMSPTSTTWRRVLVLSISSSMS